MLVDSESLIERTVLYVAMSRFIAELDATPTPGLFVPMAMDMRDAANDVLARLGHARIEQK